MDDGAVATILEPPIGANCTDEEYGDESRIEVHVSIGEPDGTTRSAGCTLDPDATDVVLADALLRCVRGCAEMRGPGLRRTIDQLAPIR